MNAPLPIKKTGFASRPNQTGNVTPRREPLTAAEMFTPPAFTMKQNPVKVWQPPYRCSCCNKEYNEQERNFYKTNSELYSASNGFTVVCRSCAEAYYKHCVEKLNGDEHRALLHVARMFDWYVGDDTIDEILARASAKNPVGALAQKINRANYPDGTYLDALIENIAPGEELSEPVSTNAGDGEESEIDPRAIKLFGEGFQARDYKLLLQHYDELTRELDNTDAIQNLILLNLCQIHMTRQKALMDGDMETFESMSKLYNSTLKSEGLKIRQSDEKTSDGSDTWGNFIAQVERYAPAELYRQETFYKDVDGIGDYIRRFFTRSTLNYFGKTNEKDPEYSLTEAEVCDEV